MIAKRTCLALWILTAVILPSHRLSAERLAVHTYTVADGLAGDQVTAIVQDRQGFLWIGTRTGLSRFDGVSFRSFDTSDGLPHAGVHDIVEDTNGSLWFTTGGGLVRMRTERNENGSAFEPAIGIPGGVSALVEDEEGVLWASSSGTLYRRETQGGRSFVAVEVDLSWPPEQYQSISALLAADGGGLWLGTSIGLFRLLPNGAVVRHDVENGGPMWNIFTLARDSVERIWVTGRGVMVFKPHTPRADSAQTIDSSVRRFDFGSTPKLPESPGEALRIDGAYEFTSEKVFDIDEGPDGELWWSRHLRRRRYRVAQPSHRLGLRSHRSGFGR